MMYDSVILLGLVMLASAIALPFGSIEKVALQDFWFTLWLLSVCFIYLGACWRNGGMTVGMRAWNVRLVSEDGQVISWPRCLLRFVLSIISLAVFGLGYLWVLIDKKNRAWHDSLTATILIRTSKHTGANSKTQ